MKEQTPKERKTWEKKVNLQDKIIDKNIDIHISDTVRIGIHNSMDEYLSSLQSNTEQEGEPCKCGNKTYTHRHSNWIECTKCNKIKIL